MLNKVATLFIGLCLILGGIETFFIRGYHSVMWGRYMDYGPFHKVIGAILILGGFFIAYKGTRIIIRDKRKGRPPRGDN
jgi:hypothetical protein